MSAGRQQKRSGGPCGTSLFAEIRLLLDDLRNIHSSVRYAWNKSIRLKRADLFLYVKGALMSLYRAQAV